MRPGRAWLVVSLLLSTGFGAVAPAPACAATPPTVAVQPLGDVDVALIQATASQLASVFEARIVVLDRRPLPHSAFYAPRHRYRGDRIIERLDDTTPNRIDKVIALMSSDLSTTKGSVYDWGVLGLAELRGRAAVVSVHRMQGRGASAGLVARRARRVATHELGHAFGLRHCRSRGCIMNDAEGTIRTVDRCTGAFCPACARKLRGVLRPTRTLAAAPRDPGAPGPCSAALAPRSLPSGELPS